MSANDEVRKFLDYYLSSKLSADFAVMLTGPWGAGKTHFVKEYFTERQRRAEDGDPIEPLGHLYASLYGVRSTSELMDQFFAQVHPVFGSKTGRLLGTAMSGVVKKFTGISLDKDDNGAIQELASSLQGRVLVFDDLERCGMSIADVMGFINAYVEHDGLKVIVIANELDIPPSQKDDYTRKKEKLVGKTLLVTSEPDKVLRSILSNLDQTNVIETIKRETSALLRAFEASEKRNFRSLRSVLTDYERLVSISDKRLQEAPQAMTKLLLWMVATGLEYRSGDLTGSQIAELPTTLRARSISFVTKVEKSPAIQNAERLESKYPDVDWQDAIVPCASLAKLFETGIVDVDAVNEHLSSHPLVVGYSDTPPWRRMWGWSELPRSRYLEARDEFVKQLRDRAITHPGIILHAAGIVIQADGYGDHMLGETEDICTFFERYLDDLRAIQNLEPIRVFMDSASGSYGALGYASDKDPRFRKIFNALQAATNASFADEMRKIATTYLDRIQGNPEAYSSLHEYGYEHGNYVDAPFLHYINPDDFARVVIRDWIPDGRLLSSLHARYERELHRHALPEEYEWTKSLRCSVEGIASNAEPPHKKLLESRIKYYFDMIDDAVNAAIASSMCAASELPTGNAA